MIKRIKNSLTIKICTLIAVLLAVSSGITYAVIVGFLPTYYSKQLQKDIDSVSQEMIETIHSYETINEASYAIELFEAGSKVSVVILDEQGNTVDIRPYDRNVATKLIEDFMLAANETVAADYYWRELPFVYRTHETPDPERVESLLTLLRNQGVSVQKAGEEITPKEIQEILESIHGLPNETMISRLTLRTMKQAKYTTQCSGHFGLAAKYYCHFTSPIRRYPDLQIHRIIRDNIRGRLQREGKTEHYREILETVAEQSSVCERRAQEAERESDRLKKAEYMSYHLGEEYEGIISGVTAYGFYVELPNTVEGLVHVTSLRDDYYSYNEETYELSGELSKKVYHLGQKVRVRVADADALRRTVDFTVVE